MFSRSLFRRASVIVTARQRSNVVIDKVKTFNQYTCIETKPCRNIQSFTILTRLFSTTPAFDCVNIQDADDFKTKVLDSKLPVVVDFHATWCSPCKLLAPRLEAIISQKMGKVLLAKVDIDDISELAMEYGVRSVPMVFSFKNGQVQDSFIGLIEDDTLHEFVDKLV